MAKKTIEGSTREIDLILIDEPDGMSRFEIDHDYIDELAQSISEVGLLQPILLAIQGDRFEIVAGHCRYLAHRKAGLPKIRAQVRKMTRQQIVIARATENLTRKNLSPLEEAQTYFDLVNTESMTIADIARKVGKSPGLVKRRMDLLRMQPCLRDAVHKKQITISVAEELWPITDVPTLEYYLSFALDGGCTSVVARSWCQDWRDSKRRAASADGGGGQDFAPSEPRPVYVTCDLCAGPMEIGQETVLRVCKDCHKTIKQHM